MKSGWSLLNRLILKDRSLWTVHICLFRDLPPNLLNRPIFNLRIVRFRSPPRGSFRPRYSLIDGYLLLVVRPVSFNFHESSTLTQDRPLLTWTKTLGQSLPLLDYTSVTLMYFPFIWNFRRPRHDQRRETPITQNIITQIIWTQVDRGVWEVWTSYTSDNIFIYNMIIYY